MTTAIMWFRNDLRLADNEALTRAISDFDRVIPLYILDITRHRKTIFGSQKMGSRRLKFILDSLHDLKASIQNAGSDLILEIGEMAEVMAKVVDRYRADAVLAHKEITSEEVNDEEKVERAIAGKAKLKMYWGHTLYHIDDLPFVLTDIPDVFTDFRKVCEKQIIVRKSFETPKSIPTIPTSGRDIPTLSTLGFSEKPISHKAAIYFQGGEHKAWERLHHYFWQSDNISSYKETRNGMLGEDYSSKFSGWLSSGCISPRQIYHEIIKYEKDRVSNQSTYWLKFELIWRDYFRFVTAKYGERIFRAEGIRNKLPETKAHADYLTAWKTGTTGIPFIDANMKELNETGFMSNRGRQNVASFLVKDLKQDWRAGAAYFEQELIDYDVTSNWGNWAYVAGVGNDPRPDRYFNIMTQAKKYDGDGKYVRHWCPELTPLDKDHVQTPWILHEDELKQAGLDNTAFSRPILVPQKWNV